MSDNIRVAIRLRPLIQREIETSAKILWETRDQTSITQIDPVVNYYFDRVFSGEESNEIVYKELCKPIVQSVMEGFNGTIFAYGQTSSGKTYTMLGEHGIIPSAINDIFSAIDFMADREFLLRISFLEIYNEKVFDLLVPESRNLKVQEDVDGVVSVVGLTEVEIKTSEEVFTVLESGEFKRHIADTRMNEHSSRSHAIFRMIVESRVRETDVDGAVNVAQLNLVDLAGSERAGQMGEKASKFREGTGINKSLSYLSLVIRQLSEGDRKHVSYRNSSLTRILQNSLGGNAHTLIICTVTPASLEPTQSTLSFASQAKKIKNKPTANVVWTDKALLRKYAKEICMLTEKLTSLEDNVTDKKKEILQKELEEKEKQNKLLKHQIQQLKEKFIVSQTNALPISMQKKTRRETVCFGALGYSRHLNQPENAITFFNPLPVLQEEPYTSPSSNGILEGDFRAGKVSTDSSTGSPFYAQDKVLVDASVQTARGDVSVIRKTAALLKVLMEKLQETTSEKESLRKNFEELREFTLLEKQTYLEENGLQEVEKQNRELQNRLNEADKEKSVLLLRIRELEQELGNPCSGPAVAGASCDVCCAEQKDCGDSADGGTNDARMSGSNFTSPEMAPASEALLEQSVYENDDLEKETQELWELVEKSVANCASGADENMAALKGLCSMLSSYVESDQNHVICADATCKHAMEELREIIETNEQIYSEELEALRTLNEQKEAELEEASSCIQTLEGRIFEGACEYEKLQKRLHGTVQEHLQIAEANVMLTETLCNAQEKILEMESSLEAFGRRVESYDNRIAYISLNFGMLKAAVEKYENDSRSLSAERDALAEENRELKSKITELKKDYHRKLAESTENCENEMRNVQRESEKLHERQVALLEQELKRKHEEEIRKKEAEFQSELDWQTRRFEVTKLNIEESAIRLSREFENDVFGVIADLKKALEEKSERCRNLERKVKQLAEEKGRHSGRHAESSPSAAKLQQETISKLTDEFLEKSRELQKCKIEFQRQSDVLKEEIRMLKTQAEKRGSESEVLIKELRASVEEQRKKMEMSEHKYHSMCDKLEEHKKEFEERISRLKDQYKKSLKEDHKVKDYAATISSLKTSLKEKESALSEQSSKTTSLIRELAEMRTKYSELKAEHQDVVQKMKDLRNNSEVQDKVHVRAQRATNMIQDSKEVHLAQEIQDLHQKLKKMEEENNSLYHRLSATKTELRRLQQENNESRVEPKGSQQNKENKDWNFAQVAGSGAVNAYCVEQLQGVIRAKDRHIKRLQDELQKHRQATAKVQKRDSQGDPGVKNNDENTEPHSAHIMQKRNVAARTAQQTIKISENRSNPASLGYVKMNVIDSPPASELKTPSLNEPQNLLHYDPEQCKTQ